MRLATGALALILTASALFWQVPDVTLGAQRETEPILPAGGLTGFIIETVDDSVSEETDRIYSLRSIRSELSGNDWDCYGTDYYYSKLSAKEQRFYERLDALCLELLTSSGVDAQAHTIAGTGERRVGTKLVSGQGLSWYQMEKVVALFNYSNPQYYFLNSMLFSNAAKDACALGIYSAFEKGSIRAQETQKVLTRLETLQAQISDHGIPYETEAQIHDLLCDKLTYLDGDAGTTDPYYTQTIYGALMTGETVCAGYAKLYTMLCNYFGIDCIPVTSEDHVWNEVRYGDHWYLVDVTWDDSWDRAKYFHITDSQMKAMDQNDLHVPRSYFAGMRPVADTEFSGNLMLLPGLEQPQVKIKDTAAGVMITMTSGVGEIYYTLDGTTPGETDRYTKPIELTESGTHIVTAVTARDGAISSAYEIFPVRIAAGRVSIASAVNISGKKIRVKFQTSRNYRGYEISWATKKDFSNQKSVGFDRSEVKSKLVELSRLKTGNYYIRVRGYRKDVYGNYYYTPYSKAKKVTVKK